MCEDTSTIAKVGSKYCVVTLEGDPTSKNSGRQHDVLYVCVQELKHLGSTKASEMAILLDTYTKLVSDAQKVQNSKGKDKKLLCSDFAATFAQTQVAKAAALAGV